ncbi:MAG: hypothetical protein PHG06_03765 [Parabacteroides sp.]|nr:hypothetical protein [Parabacteroides sp.]
MNAEFEKLNMPFESLKGYVKEYFRFMKMEDPKDDNRTTQQWLDYFEDLHSNGSNMIIRPIYYFGSIIIAFYIKVTDDTNQTSSFWWSIEYN